MQVLIYPTWTDVTTAQALQDGRTYAGQAIGYDVEYIEQADGPAPAQDARGFVLYAGNPVEEYDQKSGVTLWMRRRSPGPGECVLMLAEV